MMSTQRLPTRADHRGVATKTKQKKKYSMKRKRKSFVTPFTELKMIATSVFGRRKFNHIRVLDRKDC